MTRTITLAEVDEAEASLIEAKGKRGKRRAGPDDYQDLKRAVVDLRQKWRRQEEKAERRCPVDPATGLRSLVGGDAARSGGAG